LIEAGLLSDFLVVPLSLILRSMNRHAQIMGRATGWSDDDYVVIDGERSVGRIHKTTIHDARSGIGRSTPARTRRRRCTTALPQRSTLPSRLSKRARGDEAGRREAVQKLNCLCSDQRCNCRLV